MKNEKIEVYYDAERDKIMLYDDSTNIKWYDDSMDDFIRFIYKVRVDMGMSSPKHPDELPEYILIGTL